LVRRPGAPQCIGGRASDPDHPHLALAARELAAYWQAARTPFTVALDPQGTIAQIRKTPPDVVKLIDELLETSTDMQAAARLNELGHRNWRGEPFSPKKVLVVRNAYKLRSRFERLRERGMLTGDSAVCSPSLVARVCRARGQHCPAVVLGKLFVRPVRFGVVAVGGLDERAGLVGHDQAGHAGYSLRPCDPR